MTTSHRCKATTGKGTQCRQTAINGDYCGLHLLHPPIEKVTHIVVITFEEEPEDPITEVVGPFDSQAEAMKWVKGVEDALRERKARYLTTRLSRPFYLT